MKEVVIKSKIVGKVGATGGGKPVAFPDLSAYALRSDFLRLESSFNDFLEGDDTDNVINRWKELEAFLDNISEDYNLLAMLNGKADKATTLSGYGITDAYTKTNVDDLLKAYVTLSGTQTITGEKNFTGGLKVNGSPIYYDSAKKYWKLEGDLLVTGGVTMYGSDSSFTPSTIMDALLYDDTTLGINSNGQLYVKGGTSGGGLDITALQNYLTSNSYLNVTEGDNRYLMLSGGRIVGKLQIQRTPSNIAFYNADNVLWGHIGFNAANNAVVWDRSGANEYTIWHSGNDGSGSGLDADLLDGVQSSGYGQYVDNLTINLNDARDGLRGGKLYNATNAYDSTDASYRGFLEYGSSGYRAQFNSSSSNNLYYRWCEANTWKPWRKVAFEDSNVASATKLKTARTIWGQNFDGTANVDGDLHIKNENHINVYDTIGSSHIALFMSETNNLHLGRGVATAGYNTYINGKNIYFQTLNDELNVVMSVLYNGDVGIGTPIPGYKLDVVGDIGCYSIFPKSVNLYRLGDWENYFQMANINIIYGGAKSNNLWLVGGKESNELGVVFGRNTTNTVSGAEMCRFNANGLVWAKGVKGDIRTVDTAIELIKNNTESNAVYLGDGTFSPFLASSDLLSLGISSKRWNGVYLGTDTSAVNTRGVVFCNSSSNQLALIGTNNSGDCGIYSRSSIILRPGGDSNSDGTIAPKAIGVTISANGDLLVTGGITMYSDQRKKTILNHVELSLKDIANAPLIEHYYNSDDAKTTHVGSIAQYWASMNDWFCKLDSEGYYTMEIQNAALASAISIARELDRYETKTAKAIKKLKKRICELEEEVERLKAS